MIINVSFDDMLLLLGMGKLATHLHQRCLPNTLLFWSIYLMLVGKVSQLLSVRLPYLF